MFWDTGRGGEGGPGDMVRCRSQERGRLPLQGEGEGGGHGDKVQATKQAVLTVASAWPTQGAPGPFPVGKTTAQTPVGFAQKCQGTGTQCRCSGPPPG